MAFPTAVLVRLEFQAPAQPQFDSGPARQTRPFFFAKKPLKLRSKVIAENVRAIISRSGAPPQKRCAAKCNASYQLATFNSDA
jgi:hypothetical protein